MLDGHRGQRLTDRFVITKMRLIVIHRAMCAKELAGLPNADLVLLMGVRDQFSFFSRP